MDDNDREPWQKVPQRIPPPGSGGNDFCAKASWVLLIVTAIGTAMCGGAR